MTRTSNVIWKGNEFLLERWDCRGLKWCLPKAYIPSEQESKLWSKYKYKYKYSSAAQPIREKNTRLLFRPNFALFFSALPFLTILTNILLQFYFIEEAVRKTGFIGAYLILIWIFWAYLILIHVSVFPTKWSLLSSFDYLSLVFTAQISEKRSTAMSTLQNETQFTFW